MELPADTLARFTAQKSGAPRNEREELINNFLTRLNPPRVKAGYKEYTFKRLAGMFKERGMKESDIYWLYRRCEDARSFGAMFNYLMKS